MPGGKGFVSTAQRGFMFAKHPDVAKRFSKETPKGKPLPEHVGGKISGMYAKMKGKS